MTSFRSHVQKVGGLLIVVGVLMIVGDIGTGAIRYLLTEQEALARWIMEVSRAFGDLSIAAKGLMIGVTGMLFVVVAEE